MKLLYLHYIHSITSNKIGPIGAQEFGKGLNYCAKLQRLQ